MCRFGPSKQQWLIGDQIEDRVDAFRFAPTRFFSADPQTATSTLTSFKYLRGIKVDSRATGPGRVPVSLAQRGQLGGVFLVVFGSKPATVFFDVHLMNTRTCTCARVTGTLNLKVKRCPIYLWCAFATSILFILASTIFPGSRSVIVLPNAKHGLQPSYSSHKCIGSRKETRSCLFKNLYFDTKTRKFEYYVEPKSMELPVSFDGGFARHGFADGTPGKIRNKGKGSNSQGFLFLHAGGRRGKSQTDRRWYEPWKAIKIISPAPNSTEVHTYAGVHLLWESVAPASFGHTLVDNVLPMYIILSTFGLDVANTQITMMASCEQHFRTQPANQSVKWCRNLREPGGFFSPTLTRKSVGHFEELVHQAKSNGKDKIHFRSVVLGGGGLALWLHLQANEYHVTYADSGRRDSRAHGVHFWNLHQHVYAQHGISERCCNISRPTITIVDKHGARGGSPTTGERRIANVDNVIQWLRERFPAVVVHKVNFQPLAWREQMQHLAETTILISPFGSVSFRSLLLPKGAYAIILGLGGVSDVRDANWESDAWLRYQSYVGIVNYPVEVSELDTRSRNPSIMMESNVIVDKTKVVGLVRQALELQKLDASDR